MEGLPLGACGNLDPGIGDLGLLGGGTGGAGLFGERAELGEWVGGKVFLGTCGLLLGLASTGEGGGRSLEEV